MPEGINKPEQKSLKLVENNKQFLERLDDARNQFITLTWDFEKGLPIEQIIKKNESYTRLLFVDYIKTQGYKLSEDIEKDEACKQLVFIHDDLIKRAKNFQTINDLKQILEEVEEFLKP